MQKQEIGTPSLQLDDQMAFKKEQNVIEIFALECGLTIPDQCESAPGLADRDLVSNVKVPATFVSRHAFEFAVQKRMDRVVGTLNANALAQYGKANQGDEDSATRASALRQLFEVGVPSIPRTPDQRVTMILDDQEAGIAQRIPDFDFDRLTRSKGASTTGLGWLRRLGFLWRLGVLGPSLRIRRCRFKRQDRWRDVRSFLEEFTT
jgi:hypothetical protein